MSKIVCKSISVVAFTVVCSAFSLVSAQSPNTIQEVKLTNNDGFNNLRNLINANFDYTNPNLEEGTFNSLVEFNVAENGKITNVHAKGDCRYVSQELEDVMKNLLYKVDLEKLNSNALTTNYVLPVVVNVKNR